MARISKVAGKSTVAGRSMASRSSGAAGKSRAPRGAGNGATAEVMEIMKLDGALLSDAGLSGTGRACPDDGKDGKARDRIIAAATRLFCQYGINAVGVDAVVAEAATAKATLYKSFGSKEKLVEAVLEKEGAAWRDWFVGELLKGKATPLARLRRIFPTLRRWFQDDHFFGCPFINAVAENDKRDDRMRQMALAHKAVILGTIESLAGEAGAQDPHGLAHQLGLLMDGAIVAAMITKDPEVARLAGQTADIILLRTSAEAA